MTLSLSDLLQRSEALQEWQTRIIEWQRRCGRHGLPWQQQSAYATWISEIMLQQTQVSTVIPYYERFMQRFPHVNALACAQIDEVLALWSGLGYYRRAKFIHQAAIQWVEQYPNEPQSLQEWMSLPGIGRSTAGAIMSLAQKKPQALYDGNAQRVFQRYFGPSFTQLSPSARWSSVQALVPEKHPDIYNQALMDLGAMRCKKHQPLCQACPLLSDCQQYFDTPIKQNKAPGLQRMHVMYAVRQDAIALVQRPQDSIWPSLWFLPDYLEAEPKDPPMLQIKHILSHRILEVSVYLHEHAPENSHWHALRDIAQLARPRLLDRILSVLSPPHHD